jgi:hypothetical protein
MQKAAEKRPSIAKGDLWRLERVVLATERASEAPATEWLQTLIFDYQLRCFYNGGDANVK